jgi:hypothetical protein
MADFYFQTIGQAWAAIAAAFTSGNQLIYNDAGFSITWTASSSVTGGYFTVSGTTYVGEPYANGNYHAADARTGGHLPLAYVLKSSGFQDIPQVTHQTASGAIIIGTFEGALETARQDAIIDITGATAGSSGLGFLQLPGGSTPFGYDVTTNYVTDGDGLMDIWGIMDLAGQSTTAPVTFPWFPTYGPVFTPTVVTNIDVGPQLDTDVAINNGSVIETVVAKQFTGI